MLSDSRGRALQAHGLERAALSGAHGSVRVWRVRQSAAQRWRSSRRLRPDSDYDRRGSPRDPPDWSRPQRVTGVSARLSDPRTRCRPRMPPPKKFIWTMGSLAASRLAVAASPQKCAAETSGVWRVEQCLEAHCWKRSATRSSGIQVGRGVAVGIPVAVHAAPLFWFSACL